MSIFTPFVEVPPPSPPLRPISLSPPPSRRSNTRSPHPIAIPQRQPPKNLEFIRNDPQTTVSYSLSSSSRSSSTLSSAPCSRMVATPQTTSSPVSSHSTLSPSSSSSMTHHSYGPPSPLALPASLSSPSLESTPPPPPHTLKTKKSINLKANYNSIRKALSARLS